MSQKVIQLKNMNKNLKRKLERANQQNVSLQKEAEERAADNCLQLKRRRGGKSAQLTLEGSFALGIRRNFSNIATSDLGAVRLEDISRFTVARSECRTGSALLASSRMWFSALYADICDPHNAQDGFSLNIYSWKQDATNSGILKGSKLSGLIMRSARMRTCWGSQASQLRDLN